MIEIKISWDISNSEDSDIREVETTATAEDAASLAQEINWADPHTALAPDAIASKASVTIAAGNKEPWTLSDLIDCDESLQDQWGGGEWDGITFTADDAQAFLDAYERLA